MIRLRMNGLMSRASTLVLAAAFGSAGTAVAGTTITGPGPFGHVHITNNTDFVVIEVGATIGVDPLPGGVNSFANDPGIVITSLTTGVEIDDSTLLGRFVNNGTILGAVDGVNIFNSTLQAGFTNAGVIEGSEDGVVLQNTFLNLSGGFTNTGRITSFGGVASDDDLSGYAPVGGRTPAQRFRNTPAGEVMDGGSGGAEATDAG